ncbi:hypothetical protein [Corallococcus exercitus]|uniref:Uncharacterized protein n=1 Tax=Corallococcus exercitus TaxID=2316736 RepID=A0A7Y4JN53_9BACT|nr:hypothetical protein [Corallococcus exercitus]NOK08091.1 hypothetical protein [Corallococcus exercitus]
MRDANGAWHVDVEELLSRHYVCEGVRRQEGTMEFGVFMMKADGMDLIPWVTEKVRVAMLAGPEQAAIAVLGKHEPWPHQIRRAAPWSR